MRPPIDISDSLLRNVHQYIFPTLCNTLDSKKSNFRIYDMDYRRDVLLRMRVGKEIIKKQMMRKKIKITRKN